MDAYTNTFYRDLDATAAPSAAVIVPIVKSLIDPKSVVDVGCGDGSWLGVFRQNGVERVLGFEGHWIDADDVKIPADRFRRVDLSQPFETGESFDLAISLEVAEHLPPARAPGFVEILAGLAPVVLFSAAVPHQGGVNHLNEQWPAYWAALFAGHGLVPVDAIRWRVWNDARVTWWYKQNLLLFATRQALETYPELSEARAAASEALDVVHPEMYAKLVRKAEPGLGRWLRMAPNVVRRALAKKASRG